MRHYVFNEMFNSCRRENVTESRLAFLRFAEFEIFIKIREITYEPFRRLLLPYNYNYIRSNVGYEI